MDADELTFCTVEEAARRLAVSKALIYKMLDRQIIASRYIGTRARRVVKSGDPKSLDSYMASLPHLPPV